MRITHLGHACVLIESDGGGRLLIDPGTYSSGFEGLTGLSAIAVTHQHPDHVDPTRLEDLVDANPDAQLLLESETAAAVEDPRVTAVSAGQELAAADLTLRAVGGQHAVNHDQVPTIGNVGYIVEADGRRFFHPGDSYDEAPSDIDVLGLPLNAPWCRMAETLGFLHAVSPRVVVPIHTGLLNEDGLAGYLMHVERFGPDGCEVVDLRPGQSYAG
jgi:L-ascorbate metabolism protein UlaG (beta-lactamase superfamily)